MNSLITQNTAIAVQQRQSELQAGYMVAFTNPRNEEACIAEALKAFSRPRMAEKAMYAFERGKKKNERTGAWDIPNIITGPSVQCARELARIWGNISHSTTIVEQVGDEIVLECVAIDMQKNTRITVPARFLCLVQRKDKTGKTNWITPDERDKRELVNKQIALCERKALLSLIPADIVADVQDAARRALEAEVKGNESASVAKLQQAFAELQVEVWQLEGWKNKALKDWNPSDIADARNVFQSIKAGEIDAADMFEKVANREMTEQEVTQVVVATNASRGQTFLYNLNKAKIEQSEDIDAWIEEARARGVNVKLEKGILQASEEIAPLNSYLQK